MLVIKYLPVIGKMASMASKGSCVVIAPPIEMCTNGCSSICSAS